MIERNKPNLDNIQNPERITSQYRQGRLGPHDGWFYMYLHICICIGIYWAAALSFHIQCLKYIIMKAYAFRNKNALNFFLFFFFWARLCSCLVHALLGQGINWHQWNGALVSAFRLLIQAFSITVQFKSISCHITFTCSNVSGTCRTSSGFAYISNSFPRKLRLKGVGLGHDQLFLRPKELLRKEFTL